MLLIEETMKLIDPTWSELIIGIVSAVLGWFSKHFADKRKFK